MSFCDSSVFAQRHVYNNNNNNNNNNTDNADNNETGSAWLHLCYADCAHYYEECIATKKKSYVPPFVKGIREPYQVLRF